MRLVLQIVMLTSIKVLAQEPLRPATVEEKIPKAGSVDALVKKQIQYEELEEELWNSAALQNDPRFEAANVSESVRVEDIVDAPMEYSYAGFSKSDPFIPPFRLFVTDVLQPIVSGFEIPIVSPLQVENLNRLRVIGAWELESGERRALILAGDKGGIIAKIGDPVGLSGKIVEINEAGVVAREYEIRQDGSRTYKDTLLPLGQPKIEDKNKRIILEPGRKPTVQGDEDEEAIRRLRQALNTGRR